jgi:hypothetical protein
LGGRPLIVADERKRRAFVHVVFVEGAEWPSESDRQVNFVFWLLPSTGLGAKWGG